MQMDPQISIWLNVAYAILTGITAPALQMAGVINASQVVAIAALIAMPLNIIAHAYSSPLPGPLAGPKPPAAPIAKNIALFIATGLIGGMLMFAGAGHAFAAEKPVHLTPHRAKGWWHPLPPLNPIHLQTPDQIIAKVLNWATADGDADLTAAILVAKANNDNVTRPCWLALQSFVKGVEALPPVATLPKLHLAVDIEVATDLMIALQPSSPVVSSCQGLANFQKMSAVNMVAGLVTGALSISALAPIIPIP